MLITQNLQGSDNLLDVVLDADKYKKEIKTLREARVQAEEAVAKMTKGKSLEKMEEKAKGVRKEALDLLNQKIAESEVLIQEAKDEAKVIRAEAVAQKKAAKAAMERAKQAVKDSEELSAQAKESSTLTTSLKAKAEKEYASAMGVKASWNDKIQDLKERLKGVI